MDAETLRQYLEYYDDLGIKTLYRRAGEPLADTRGSAITEQQPTEPR